MMARDGLFRIFTLILLIAVLCVSSALADSYESVAGGDTLCYLIKPGDSLLRIAKRHRSLARYYAVNDLVRDIRRVNHLDSDLLQIGDRLLIPVQEEQPIPQVERPVLRGAEVRGIYLTAAACSHSSVFRRIDAFIAAGGNAVVIDIKDIDGGVSCRSGIELAAYGHDRRSPLISDLPDFIDRLHQRGLYVIARQALFLDGELGRQRPDLALAGPDGAPWTERGQAWVDPASAEVRGYNIALAQVAAAAGTDEIQFDYVRYPTNGWRRPGGEVMPGHERRCSIVSFVREARLGLSGTGVQISVDLFGIVGWNRPADSAVTGQDVAAIAHHVDIICPMVYPSHFGPGYGGFDRPADHPEHFVGEATRRFVELAAGRARIRPWLQAFSWGVRDYDASYVQRQIWASRRCGGAGWCLWNPSGNYSTALSGPHHPLPDILFETAPRMALQRAVLPASEAAGPPMPSGTVDPEPKKTLNPLAALPIESMMNPAQ